MSKFDKALDELVINIGKDYEGWGKPTSKDTEKSEGILKGIPYRRGDVFMAAGWASPAKHVRGSVFDDSTSWFSWTGPRYL